MQNSSGLALDFQGQGAQNLNNPCLSTQPPCIHEVLDARIKVETCMHSNRPHQHEAWSSLLRHLGCSLMKGKGLERVPRRVLREPRSLGRGVQGLEVKCGLFCDGLRF